MSTLVDRLKALLPGESPEENLCIALLDSAKDTLLNLTNRTVLPEGMQGLQLRLAVVRYNLLGMEGETGRREGSISVQVEHIPTDMLREIKAWRLGRISL